MSDVYKFGKKLFTLSVVAVTIAWSMGLAALVPAVAQAEEAVTLEAGDLFKVPGKPAVYMVTESMGKAYFPSLREYTYYHKIPNSQPAAPDFSKVFTITEAQALTYLNDGAVHFPAGKLVKSQNFNAVYQVLPNNEIRHITSATVAAELYGANWASTVSDVADVFLDTYTDKGTKISESKLQNGMLVKTAGSSDVYYVSEGKKLKVDGGVDLTSNLVRTVSQTVFDTAETGSTTTTEAEILSSVSAGKGDSETPAAKGDLMVSLAASTAPTAIVPKKAVAVPYLTVNMKAGSSEVKVTGLTLERTGLGLYSDFEKVWVEVDGARKGSQKSVSSNNEASLVFGTSPVVIPAGQTKAFIVYANMDVDSPVAGTSNAFSVKAVSSNGTVSGLPVTGNTITVGSVNAPTATYEQVSVASSVSIGDEDATVAKIKVTNTNTSEDIDVKGFVFKSIAPSSGTRIDSDDVTNYELFKGTTKVAGPVQMSSDNYVTFNLATPVTIEKGGSKNETFTVKADVADGPGRIIKLDVEYDSDVIAVGKNNSFRTYQTDSYTAQEVTIGASDLVLTTDSVNNPAARNVLKNTTQTLLKGYINASKGEVEVTGFRFTLTGNDMDFGATNEYDNLRVYVGGVLVGEATADDISTSNNVTSTNVSFTDDFVVSGKKSLEVTIDVKDVTDTDWIYATASGASGWTAVRTSDSASVTPGGSVTGNKVSINQPSLTLTLSATPVSVTRVKGSSTNLMGFNMATGVADEVTVSSLTFEMDSTGDLHDDPDLTNVYLTKTDGTVVAGPVNFNSSNQVVFTGLNIKVAAGETMKYMLKGTLAASFSNSSLADLWVKAADIDAVDSQGTDIASVTGVDSGAINAVGTVKLTLVDRGTLDIALSNATPKTRQVLANSTNDLSTKVTLYAEYEDVLVKKLVFTTVGGSANDDDIKRVTLKQGETVLGTTEAISSGVVTFNIAAPYLKVPADGNVTLDLYTDYQSTVNSVADSGATIQWSIANFRTGVEADGTLNDIYAAVETYNGTGVTLSTGASTTINEGALFSATDTTLTVTSASGISAGDLLLLDDDGNAAYSSGDEYVLVLSVSGNDLTVRRGVGGVTAGTVDDGDAVYLVTQLLKGNTALLYANKPTLGYSASVQANGTLAVDTFEVLRFDLTDSSAGEEDVRLEELIVTITGSGMATSGGDGWYITNAYLYNGNNQVGSTVTTDVTSSGGTITFSGLDSDDDSILGAGTTFVVKVEVAEGSGGGITAGDTLRASIANLGSANAAGTISAGHLDWEDQEAPTSQVEWIDTTIIDVRGGLYQKLT